MGGGNTAVNAVKGMPEYMDVKIIESSLERCEQLNDMLDSHKALVINGDGRDLSLLTEESINNTQAFVALTGNTETNILACLTAKRMGVRKTVAMVENLDYVSMAESLDIGTIINKKAIAASRIYRRVYPHGELQDYPEARIRTGTATGHDHRRTGKKRRRYAGVG